MGGAAQFPEGSLWQERRFEDQGTSNTYRLGGTKKFNANKSHTWPSEKDHYTQQHNALYSKQQKLVTHNDYHGIELDQILCNDCNENH